MKFICEKCEVPMEFVSEDDLSRESMKVVFRCGGCGVRFSMVTNPGETQLIYSLGIKMGGKEADKPLELTRTTLKGEKTAEAFIWTPGAEARLGNAPALIRPMAKRAVEKLAGDKGLVVIDEELMDEVKGKFMEG